MLMTLYDNELVHCLQRKQPSLVQMVLARVCLMNVIYAVETGGVEAAKPKRDGAKYFNVTYIEGRPLAAQLASLPTCEASFESKSYRST